MTHVNRSIKETLVAPFSDIWEGYKSNQWPLNNGSKRNVGLAVFESYGELF